MGSLRFLVLLGLLLYTTGACAQLMLQNTVTNKVKTLKYGGDIRLNSLVQGPDISEGDKTIEGELTQIKGQYIQVLPEYDQRVIVFKNGLRKESSNDYEQLKGLQPLSVELNGLYQIGYRSARAKKTEAIGGLLTVFGGLSALVVAPLVSIDYSDGSFNKDRYYEWAGTSLAATGLGVAFLVGSSRKKYRIQSPGDEKDNKLWRIVLK
jgi:hypothetical protein